MAKPHESQRKEPAPARVPALNASIGMSLLGVGVRGWYRGHAGGQVKSTQFAGFLTTRNKAARVFSTFRPRRFAVRPLRGGADDSTANTYACRSLPPC